MSVAALPGPLSSAFDTDEKLPLDRDDQQRLCSKCEQLLPLKYFHKQGARFSRRCYKCVCPALWGKAPHKCGLLRPFTVAEKRERRKANLHEFNMRYRRYNKKGAS